MKIDKHLDNNHGISFRDNGDSLLWGPCATVIITVDILGGVATHGHTFVEYDVFSEFWDHARKHAHSLPNEIRIKALADKAERDMELD